MALGVFLNLAAPSIALAAPSDAEILPPKAVKIWQEPRFGRVDFFSGPSRNVTETYYYSSKNSVKRNTEFYEKLWSIKPEKFSSAHFSDVELQVFKNPAMPEIEVSVMNVSQYFCNDETCGKKIRGAKSMVAISRTYQESFADNLRKFTGISAGELEKYAAMPWEFISVRQLEGFDARWPMELKGECIYSGDSQNYLTQGGGYCGYSTWIELNRAGNIERIDSMEKFKSIVLPLKNTKSAASFLNLIKVNVSGHKDRKYSAYVLKVPEGYLLYTPDFGDFGCGDVIANQEEIYLVTPNGETTKMASRVWQGVGQICVD